MTIPCSKETEIALLKKDNETMANNVNEIKGDVSEIKKDMGLIKEHILTAPQKFPSREEFEDQKKENTNFKNKINIKIAGVSGGFAVIMFLLNKYL